ncbi:MAG: hypothetical protein IJ757_08560 [Clostridiales bacterium]|nr:hypothetical protein [Clostridiales bacterium]
MSTLNLKRAEPTSRFTSKALFLYALVIFLFSPFAGITSMYGMIGDTAIQIKLGLDDLAQGRLITDEIYSWHDGLVFTAHESGWYLLLGVMYKLMKLWGVIAVGALFVYATGITAVNYIKDKVHPFLAALVIIVTPWLGGFPDYNVRPAVTSIFAVTLLMVTMLGDRKPLYKASVFSICCFFLGWLQGGILPLFMVTYLVFIAVELIYRSFREAGILSCGVLAGFILSLLNPMGIRSYLFGLKQSGATDIWALVDEWNPMHFSILQIVLILLVFVGFMTGDGIRSFRKNSVTKLLMLCMFFILTLIYKRFVVYYSVAFLLFAPEQYESLLKWLWTNVVKASRSFKLDLSDGFYRILAAVCAVMLIGLAAFYIPKYLPTGTMADVEVMAAYDPEAVDFIKSRGYEKIFNSFNTGSWLIFHDVKVHIDNRIDPYMSEFSPEDHIRGQMGIGSLAELDAFRGRYDNDAFLINYDSYLVYEIMTYAPDRYEIVYDNTVESNVPGVGSNRWIIIECK